MLNSKKMEGRSKFCLPTAEKLEVYFNLVKSAEKREMISNIAEGEQ